MEKTLSALLWGLAKDIVEKVAECRATDRLVRTRALYVKNEVTGFTYDYDKRSTSYKESFVNIQKVEWDWRDQFGFIEEEVKNIPEYSACVTEISKRCQVFDRQADFWVTRFVQFVVGKIAAGDTGEESLVDQIAVFLADLDGSPVDWKYEVWLDGIWLEDEQYEIEDGMVLRRPNPSDIETETRFELWPVQSPTSPGIHPWHIPSAILESMCRGSDNREIQREIKAILDTFCLFRLGSVVARETIMSARSILRAGTMHSPSWDIPAIYKYGLAVADVDSLQTFLRKMKPLLFLDSSVEASTERISPLSIALERYKDALLQRVPIESRITSAITCFEALYLKRQERMELSHRLSQRVSALLRLLGLIPLKAYNELSRAYEIRSIFIHGSQIDRDRQSSAIQLCKTIMDYARISLIAFIQLQDSMDKEALINKLDNSLLDENALDKVRQLFSDDLLIPGLSC